MAFSIVHNYYERLVEEHLNTLSEDPSNTLSEESLEDIACLALNKLPPRYIKHDIDILFYVCSQEQSEMRDKVINAINESIHYVRAHPR